MPFLGVAVVKQVSDNLVRITGLTVQQVQGLALPGTIGLFENSGAPSVRLPEGFKPRDYDRPDGAPVVSLSDSVQVQVTLVGQQTTVPGIEITKSGATPATFLLSFNRGGLVPDPPLPPGDSGEIEIHIRFH